MINPLIIVRDVHFASTLVAAGIVFFDLLIAAPVLASASRCSKAEHRFRAVAGRVLWGCLAASVISALAWLGLLSARIADKAFSDAVADGTVWTVLTQTQFGLAWSVRLLFAALLAACLLTRRRARDALFARGISILASLLAGGYLGALAFAGHGEEGIGDERNLHLVADFLHLNAAGLWLGALVPLTLLLAYLRRYGDDGWMPAAAAAAERFSSLGILAVGVLLVSGTINAAFLLGGTHSLIDSAYGRLLLVKIVLFTAMVALATVNRQSLLPRLSAAADAGQGSLTVRRLVRSALVEIAFGLAIVCIVGALGIMAPPYETSAHLH